MWTEHCLLLITYSHLIFRHTTYDIEVHLWTRTAPCIHQSSSLSVWMHVVRVPLPLRPSSSFHISVNRWAQVVLFLRDVYAYVIHIEWDNMVFHFACHFIHFQELFQNFPHSVCLSACLSVCAAFSSSFYVQIFNIHFFLSRVLSPAQVQTESTQCTHCVLKRPLLVIILLFLMIIVRCLNVHLNEEKKNASSRHIIYDSLNAFIYYFRHPFIHPSIHIRCAYRSSVYRWPGECTALTRLLLLHFVYLFHREWWKVEEREKKQNNFILVGGELTRILIAHFIFYVHRQCHTVDTAINRRPTTETHLK